MEKVKVAATGTGCLSHLYTSKRASLMRILRVRVQDGEGEGGGHWHRLLVPPVHKLKG
jgi:hypothetical protein